MISLTTLAIRGTLGPKSINTGPAYFCASAPIAQLTLNGLFTLREAAISLKFREEKLDKYYSLLPPEQASKNTVALVSRPGDILFQSPSNPLRRISDSGQPRHDYNVVLVVLESLSWQYIGAMGGVPSYTPNFDKLIAQGLFMEECFAVGSRTTRGFTGIVSGYPDLPGKSVSTRPQTEGTFLTIGSVLESRGYETMFIYGGQPSYDHRQAFLASNGYNRMVFKDDFSARTFKGELGYCDEDLYNQAHLEFQRCKDKPFFATMLTLSFHQSWKIPPGKITPEPASSPFHDQIDALRYTDWAIGRFIDQASKAPYFKNTIFVFVADHTGGFKEHPHTAGAYRVPFLVYAPQIVQPARVPGICSQVDVAPTIMHLLGGSYEHCFFGSSVLNREPGSGFAWILNGQQLIFIDGLRQGVAISPNDQQTFFKFSLPNTLDTLDSELSTVRLSQMPVSILQVATDLYKNNAYNLFQSSSQAVDIRPTRSKEKQRENRDLGIAAKKTVKQTPF
jgi:phosphoglycerol transferase MdoB-like AlkP superfamily enzyme